MRRKRRRRKRHKTEAVDFVHPSVGQARPDRNNRHPQGGPREIRF